jgi:hypothetical protein
MELKHGLISADDHVQEHPEVWTARMSRAKWGDRIPHIAHLDDGSQEWMIEGWRIPLRASPVANAAMKDRAQEPKRWADVPRAVFSPAERLRAMDTMGSITRFCIRRSADSRGKISVILSIPTWNWPVCRLTTIG